MSVSTIYYTAHHNWAWVLKEAIEALDSENVVSKLVLKFSDLPSQQISKTKPTYALFRLEIENNNISESIIKNHATSLCFAHLDPKDALLREMLAVNVQHCMPPTTLIEWDSPDTVSMNDFPSFPAVLKAALGSGGFGLYFVYTPYDVTEVMKAHKARAERTEGFIDDLIRDYQAVPSWSLQALVPSVRVVSNDNRKCQIRGYVVECNGNLYLFNEYEVRVPCWDIDLDVTLAEELQRSQNEPNGVNQNIVENRWSTEVENECCGRGNARPYNEHRNKSKTERYLLDEITELNGSKEVLQRVMRQSMKGIKSRILAKGGQSIGVSGSLSSTMAIAGIDLLVSRNDDNSTNNSEPFNAYIVEINNNPAMAAPNKHMSPRYREHLITLVSSILKLGIREAIGSDHNEWSDLPTVLHSDFFNDLNERWEIL